MSSSSSSGLGQGMAHERPRSSQSNSLEDSHHENATIEINADDQGRESISLLDDLDYPPVEDGIDRVSPRYRT